MTNKRRRGFAADRPGAASEGSSKLTLAIITLFTPVWGFNQSLVASPLKAGFTGQTCRYMKSLKKSERVSFVRFSEIKLILASYPDLLN